VAQNEGKEGAAREVLVQLSVGKQVGARVVLVLALQPSFAFLYCPALSV